MTDYTDLSDSSIESDKVFTKTHTFAFRDNLKAFAEGNTTFKAQTGMYGSSTITADKMAADSVGQSEIIAGAVHQSELDTSLGEVSASMSSGPVTLTLPGGQYGFYPQVRANSVHSSLPFNVQIINASDSSQPTSYGTYITLDYGDASGRTGYARQRYVNSSPPINLGDGDIPLFVFVVTGPNGDIKQTYAADVPPWLYNGPTDCRPDQVRKDGKRFKWVRSFNRLTGEVAKQLVEITQEMKNADMHLYPHPFKKLGQSDRIVLLDPPDTLNLQEIQLAGESVADLLQDGYISLDNSPIARVAPQNVQPVRFRWRLTGQR